MLGVDILLKHVSNGYVGKKMLDSSLPKIKDDDRAAQQFEGEFNISRKTMRVVGVFELIGSIFMFMTLFGKRFVRIGTVMINMVLGVAILKHFKAGHGFKGAKEAMKLFGLNILNFREAMRK